MFFADTCRGTVNQRFKGKLMVYGVVYKSARTHGDIPVRPVHAIGPQLECAIVVGIYRLPLGVGVRPQIAQVLAVFLD